MRNSNTKKSLVYFSMLVAVFVLIKYNSTYAAPAYPPQEDPYAAFAEVMPEPVGGMAAVVKKISYPEMARKNGVEGKVYVLVMINEKGGVDDVKVIRGIGAGCDEAAVRAVKECKFNPGKSKGAAVKVKLSLPISFKL